MILPDRDSPMCLPGLGSPTLLQERDSPKIFPERYSLMLFWQTWGTTDIFLAGNLSLHEMSCIFSSRYLKHCSFLGLMNILSYNALVITLLYRLSHWRLTNTQTSILHIVHTLWKLSLQVYRPFHDGQFSSAATDQYTDSWCEISNMPPASATTVTKGTRALRCSICIWFINACLCYSRNRISKNLCWTIVYTSR